MKIGVIGRADYSGLGSMTVDFCNNMEVEAAAIINRDSRGPTEIGRVCTKGKCVLTMDDNAGLVQWFHDQGVDIVVGFETFYSDRIIWQAHQAGIKTVVFVMGECSPDQMVAADVVIGLTEFDAAPFKGSVRMEWPCDSPRQEVANPPRHFLVSGGSLGLNDRNNVWASILAAEYLAGTGATLTVRTTDPLPEDLIAVGLRNNVRFAGPMSRRGLVYAGYDCLIHLQAFGGLSLPMLEAKARGIPVIGMMCGRAQEKPILVDWGIPHFTMETHAMMDREVIFGRPGTQALGARMRAAAMNGIECGLTPPTWETFRDAWKEVVG